MTTEPTGIELLRETMVSRSRIPRFLSDVARQVGVSPHALFAFAGGALLSNDVLRQLAIILMTG